MLLTKKEKKTLQYYDTHAKEWTDARRIGSKSFWERSLERFHKLLPRGKVLEIGSGSGKEAAWLMAFGYDYTGTDASLGLLSIARKDNPKGVFLHKSVYDLDFPNRTFDGFWTAATLLHVPKSRIKEALKSIRRVVKPKGIGFISLKEGRGESVEKETGRFFAYYRLDEFSQILNSVKFSIIEAKRIMQESRGITWLTYFVKT